MLSESEKGSTLWDYIEAEAYNLDQALELFGNSLAIVEDVGAVYGLITGYCESLKSKSASDNPEAFTCIVLLFSSSRIAFKLGIVTRIDDVRRRHVTNKCSPSG